MDEPGRTKRAIAALKRLDSGERMIALARAGRRRLPGDHRYGDSLSLTGDHAPALIGRGLTAMGEQRPSALRELGMGALQVWQSLSEAQGRGQGEEEVTIVFTDLVGFSDWVLDAGDDEAVVNVAARVAGAAGSGEVLVSDAVRDRLDPDEISTRRRWRFKEKGTPRGCTRSSPSRPAEVPNVRCVRSRKPTRSCSDAIGRGISTYDE